jgi:ribosome-binding factor A
MAKSIRAEKVSAEILKLLSQILREEVRDARVTEHFGSILSVDVTGDLRHATIKISVYGSDEEKADFMEGINSAKGFIRTTLGKNVRLRSVPELHFKLDVGIEEGSKMLAYIEQLKAEGKF